MEGIGSNGQSLRSASCLHRIGSKILGQLPSSSSSLVATSLTGAEWKPAYKWRHIPSILAGDPNTKSSLIGSGLQSGILHAYASVAGAYDLNVGGQRPNLGDSVGHTTKQECIYLLGADFDVDWGPRDKSSHKAIESKKPLIIYQGHHGDLGARQADIILPSSSYVEKSGLYVNTEGRVQQSQAAIRPSGAQADIRDDFMILQALSNLLSSDPLDGSSTDSHSSWSALDSFAGIERPITDSLVFVEARGRLHNESPLSGEWIYRAPAGPQSNNCYFFKYTEQVSFLERTLSDIYVSALRSNKSSA